MIETSKHEPLNPWDCSACRAEASRLRAMRTYGDDGPFDDACKKCWHLGGHHETCPLFVAHGAKE